VEEKGYKSMINLPDWLNIHNIIIKIRKSFENGRFFLFPTYPFQRRTRMISSISMMRGSEGFLKKFA
jgi:hypothetical protein